MGGAFFVSTACETESGESGGAPGDRQIWAGAIGWCNRLRRYGRSHYSCLGSTLLNHRSGLIRRYLFLKRYDTCTYSKRCVYGIQSGSMEIVIRRKPLNELTVELMPSFKQMMGVRTVGI